MIRASRWLAPAALGLALGITTAAQAASWTDFLFGSKTASGDKAAVPAERRIWRIGEYTAIQRAERESGAPANQQPATIAPETLRALLAPARLVTGRNSSVPLFHPDELSELIEPLAEALSVAGPGDDLLLLSTHRRGEGILRTPTGLTARLFVQGDALNLIVHEARRDFVNAAIGSRIPPSFTFGSRGAAGAVSLQDPGATLKRADWLVIPLQRAAAAAPVAVPAPAVLPAVVAPPPAPAPQAVAPTPAPAPAPKAAPASADEIEQRLVTLKRLRERGLISEEEYQQKRREILQTL